MTTDADDVELERSRCTTLVQAVVDSVYIPTAMILVITAERILGGPPFSTAALAERERCARILDAANARCFASNPAKWALASIMDGTDVEPSEWQVLSHDAGQNVAPSAITRVIDERP